MFSKKVPGAYNVQIWLSSRVGASLDKYIACCKSADKKVIAGYLQYKVWSFKAFFEA